MARRKKKTQKDNRTNAFVLFSTFDSLAWRKWRVFFDSWNQERYIVS